MWLGSGGEVLAQTLGGHVTVGMGGYQEFAQQISSGKLRALAITSDKRLPGVNIPTLKEQGINVESEQKNVLALVNNLGLVKK